MTEGPSTYNFVVMLVVVPFLCYYLGVFIRKTVYPSADSPSLRHQFLIAIPLSIAVIAPLILTIVPAISDAKSLSGYLVTVGIIIEHGMFLNEAVSTRFVQHGVNI